AECLAGGDQRFQVGDGAALLGPRRVGLALLLNLDLAHGVAHRASGLVASIGNHSLEIFLRRCAQHARLMRKALVDALHRERRADDGWARARRIYPAAAAMLAAGREPD